MGNVYTKSGALARRIYFGATTVWENLYYFLQKRVLADGGTFVENDVLISDDGASLILTPNAFKVGKLYSAKPDFGAGDFTVDRNSTATYIGQDGLIKTALANVPRIDWSTGVPVVLVEPQSTNLVVNSALGERYVYEQGDENYLAPNGALEAFYPLPDATTSRFQKIIVASSFVSGTELSYSWYRKRVTTPLDTTHIGDLNIMVLINATNTATTQIESDLIGFDRFKSIFTITDGSLDATLRFYYGEIIGIGNQSIAYWGHQLEQASTASSYIPTNGTTVTRLADDISVPTPAGVVFITETIDGVEQTPITTIPTTYTLPVGNINKVTML